MEIPQSLAEWEVMRMKHTSTKEYAAAEEVAKVVCEIAYGYNRGLILADDFVAAVQRIVLV